MQNSTVLTTLTVMSRYDLNVSDDMCITHAWSRRINIVLIVLNSLTSVLGVIGNGLVIFFTSFRMKKTAKTVFFLNLAIADFTFSFFLPLLFVSIALDYWPFGQAMCKLVGSVIFLNLYSSIFFLTVISIGRWICVWYPLWARKHETPQLAAFVTLAVWILSFMLSSPYIHLNERVSDQHNVTHCFTDYGHTEEQARFTWSALVISRFILAFVIPLIIIVACYGAIVLRLRRSPFAQSGKPFKVITAVTVAFFVCWFPLHLHELIPNDSGSCDLRMMYYVTYHLSYALAFSNSCLNPILYVFMGSNYQERLRWSLFSACENAFHEDSSSSRTKTKNNCSKMQESQNL